MRTDLRQHSLSLSFDQRHAAFRIQFWSLELEIWVLPFDLAQGGELVEPFVICFLVLVIFEI